MMKLVVLSCILMVTAGSVIGPLGHLAPLAYTRSLSHSVPLLPAFNYRGPLSLAPGQPANIIAADGRPFDTLDVNLDRSAHITAKALSSANLHSVKKRSILPLILPMAHTASIAYSAFQTYAAPLFSPFHYMRFLSLAPSQTVHIIDDDDDSLDVNLDRSASYSAKTLSGVGTHILRRALSFK